MISDTYDKRLFLFFFMIEDLDFFIKINNLFYLY